MNNEVKLRGKKSSISEIHTSEKGTTWCELVLSVTRTYHRGDTECSETSDIRVKCFGKLCEVAKEIKEGKMVEINGYLQTHLWTNPDGIQKVFLNVIAQHLEVATNTDAREDNGTV